MLLKVDKDAVYNACEKLLYARLLGSNLDRLQRIKRYCSNPHVKQVWLSESDFEMLGDWL